MYALFVIMYVDLSVFGGRIEQKEKSIAIFFQLVLF